MSEKSRPSIFWALAVLLLPAFTAAVRLRITDGDKLPREGAVIIAPNHFSEVDPVVMGRVVWRLGRAPRFLAKASLFRLPVVGWLLRRSGQIPVEREGSARGSAPLKAATELVEKGRAVIIYPEGSLTRDPDLWPMRGRTGAARMALTHGIEVIPMAHWGTQRLLPRYGRKLDVFPRKTIDVKVGDPVDLSAFRGKPIDSALLSAATAAIMDAVTRLLEDLRDEKAPAERWDPKLHDQKETGRFEG